MSYQFKRKNIGEILIEQGDLAAAELAFVLDKQKTTPLRFGRICVMDGLVSDDAVARALATQFGYEYADLSDFTMSEEILGDLPPDTMYRYRFIPLGMSGDALIIALADPTDVVRLDELEILLDRPLTIRVASESAIETVLKKGEGTSRVLKDVSEDFMLQLVTESEKGDEILSVEKI